MSLTASDGSMVIGTIAEAHFHTVQGRRKKTGLPTTPKVDVGTLRNEIAGWLRSGDTDRVLKGSEQLAALGPSYHEEAALTVQRALGNRSVTGSQRFLAAEVLERLGSRFHDDATKHLWEIIDGEDSEPWERERAANTLMVFGRRYYAETEHRAPELVVRRDNERSYSEWLAAFRDRRELPWGMYYEWVLECMRNPDPSNGGTEESATFFSKEARERRRRASNLQIEINGSWRNGIPWGSVFELAALGPQYRKKAENRLKSRITDSWSENIEGDDRCAEVGLALSALGPQYRESAVRTLRVAILDARTKPALCRIAALVLVEHGSEFHEEAVSALQRLLVDPTLDASDRIHVALSLAGLDAERTEEAAVALRSIVATKDVWIGERVESARVLEGFGGKYREEAGRALHEMISDNKELRLAERAETVEAIIQLGFS